MVLLVWWRLGLPWLTGAVHVQSALVWLVWIGLPTVTMPPIWVGAGRVYVLPTITAAQKARHTVDETMCYVGRLRLY